MASHNISSLSLSLSLSLILSFFLSLSLSLFSSSLFLSIFDISVLLSFSPFLTKCTLARRIKKEEEEIYISRNSALYRFFIFSSASLHAMSKTFDFNLLLLYIHACQAKISLLLFLNNIRESDEHWEGFSATNQI